MNLVLFGKRDSMVVISDANWLVLQNHMARCENCKRCSTCRTENCVAATLMIETMLPPGRGDDAAHGF